MTNKSCARNIFVGIYSKLRAWHELNLISKHSLINFTVILMNIITINKLKKENKRILWLEFGGSVQSSDFAVSFSSMLVAVACFCSSIGSTLASHRSCDVDCLFFRFGQPHSSIIFIVIIIIANLDAGFLYIKTDVLLINVVKETFFFFFVLCALAYYTSFSPCCQIRYMCSSSRFLIPPYAHTHTQLNLCVCCRVNITLH